jgi:hypothetical protein
MSDYERAFAEVMQSLLAQTPDHREDPPLSNSVDDRQEDLTLHAILGIAENAPDSALDLLSTDVIHPAVSAFDAAVARFRQQRGAR